MLKTEKILIGSNECVRTWSDTRMLIERDGVLYEEAVDPAYLGRTYTETDEPIPDVELTDSEALDIILGVQNDETE